MRADARVRVRAGGLERRDRRARAARAAAAGCSADLPRGALTVAVRDPFFTAAPDGGARERPRGRAATGRELVLAALVALLCALPFLDKPVGQLAALYPWMDASAWRARRGGDAWLALWLAGALAAAAASSPAGAGRDVLLALPPAVLLAALFGARRLGVAATRVAAGASIALGVAYAVADEDAAGAYARYAAEAAVRRAPDGAWSGSELWVVGGPALRWHLERDAGARALPARSERRAAPHGPAAGDRVLRAGLDAGAPELPRDLRARVVAEERAILVDGWPFRVQSARAGAGFHDARAGILPWTLARAPHDAIETWRVEERESDG